MEQQQIFNMLLSAFGVLGGWALKVLWDSVRDLRLLQESTRRRLNEVEVLVAGDYITRREVDTHMTRIFEKLDRIESRLAEKADRPPSIL